jgi:hypothetical protein
VHYFAIVKLIRRVLQTLKNLLYIARLSTSPSHSNDVDADEDSLSYLQRVLRTMRAICHYEVSNQNLTSIVKVCNCCCCCFFLQIHSYYLFSAYMRIEMVGSIQSTVYG